MGPWLNSWATRLTEPLRLDMLRGNMIVVY